MTLQDRIRHRLEVLDITPTEASRNADLNATYVRDLLQSESPNPRLNHLKALAKALGTPVNWLITGVEDIWDFKLSDDDMQEVLDFAKFKASQN